MIVEGVVGPQTKSDGSVTQPRLGRLAEVVTSESSGKYYELARRGQLFSAAMQAAGSLGTALTATAVTLSLYNPLGSTVNLALLQCAIAISGAVEVTTQTANAFAYAANIGPIITAPTGLTAAIVIPGVLGTQGATAAGSGGGMGRAYTAATLPATPVVVRWHPASFSNSVTTAVATGGMGGVDYVDGAIVVGPGAIVTLQGLATTTATSGVVSFVWAEIPV